MNKTIAKIAALFQNIRLERTNRNLVLCVFIINALLICLYFRIGYGEHMLHGIGGVDSNYLYMHLRSMFFDGDLRFENEVERLPWHLRHPSRTLDDRFGNPYPIGASILWAPFLLIAHFITQFTDYAQDGYSQLYLSSVYIGGSLYSALALSISAIWLRRYVGWDSALFAVTSVLLCTSLAYYCWPVVADSHGPSFFVGALYIFFLTRRGVGFISGAMLGGVFLVRWQDGLYGVLAIALSLHELYRLVRGQADSDYRKWFTKNLSFVAGFALLIAPQLLAWNAIYGSPLLIPQGSGYLRWYDPQILLMLFSPHHGLFTWHPFLLVAAFGIVLFRKHSPILAVAVWILFSVQFYINSSVLDWHGAWSFGQRRVISLMPLVAAGFGVAFQRINRSWLRKLAVAALVLTAVWNQLFLYQYNLGLIAQVAKPSWREIILDKFRLKQVREAHVGTLFAAYAIEKLKNYQLGEHYITEAYKRNRHSRHLRWPAGYYCATRPIENIDCEWLLNDWISRNPRDLLGHWSLLGYEWRTSGIQPGSVRALEAFRPELDLEPKLLAEIDSRLKRNLNPVDSKNYERLMLDRLDMLHARLWLADGGMADYYFRNLDTIREK